MKIIIASKFLYNRGGAEIQALDTGTLLKNNGHDVRFFGMKSEQNFSFEEESYFLDEVKIDGDFRQRMKATARIFGAGVTERFEKLIDDFRPDLIHLHNIHSYLSPQIAAIAYRHRIPLIWTLHDYKLICPAYSFQYNNTVCEDCLSRPLSVIQKRCMKNSFPASAIAWLEARIWSKRKIKKWTDAFICPSLFLKNKMIEGGFDADTLFHLCNFIEEEKLKQIRTMGDVPKENAYCYIGRLSAEKGSELLLRVADRLPYKIYIAGDGPLYPTLKQQYASQKIVFLGRVNKDRIIPIFSKCRYSIISSNSYENNPLGVIESLCCGTPVIGARIGGIPELIEKQNGLLFDPNDEKSMESTIIKAFESKQFDHETIKQEAMLKFSPETYYTHLINLYTSYIKKTAQ